MRILITEPGGETRRVVIAAADTGPGHGARRPGDERSPASLCVGRSLGAAGLLASNCSGFSQRTRSQSNYPQFKAAVQQGGQLSVSPPLWSSLSVSQAWCHHLEEESHTSCLSRAAARSRQVALKTVAVKWKPRIPTTSTWRERKQSAKPCVNYVHVLRLYLKYLYICVSVLFDFSTFTTFQRKILYFSLAAHNFIVTKRVLRGCLTTLQRVITSLETGV